MHLARLAARAAAGVVADAPTVAGLQPGVRPSGIGVAASRVLAVPPTAALARVRSERRGKGSLWGYGRVDVRPEACQGSCDSNSGAAEPALRMARTERAADRCLVGLTRPGYSAP